MVVLQLPSLSRATAIKIGITAALQHCSTAAAPLLSHGTLLAAVTGGAEQGRRRTMRNNCPELWTSLKFNYCDNPAWAAAAECHAPLLGILLLRTENWCLERKCHLLSWPDIDRRSGHLSKCLNVSPWQHSNRAFSLISSSCNMDGISKIFPCSLVNEGFRWFSNYFY